MARKYSKGQILVLIAAFLGWMFDGIEMGLIPIVGAPAVQDLAATASDNVIGAWLGRFAATFLLGAALGGIFFGWMGDKVGRVRSMAISIVMYSLFTGLWYFAGAPWHIAVLLFIAAIGMGGQWSLAVSLVMEVWPEKNRPMLAGVIGAANNFGLVSIAVVGFIVPITVDSWRWMALCGLIPGLLAIFVILSVPESKKWKKSVSEAKSKIKPLKEIFTPPILKNTIIGIVLGTTMMAGTWAAATTFGPRWTNVIAGPDNPFSKAAFQMAMSGGAIIGCLLAPLLAQKIGRKRAYFFCALAAFITTQVLFRTFDTYNVWLFVMIVVMGITVVSFYGLLPLYLPELFPTRVRATGSGLAYNSGRFLAAAGAVSTGTLVSYFDGDYGLAVSTITLIYIVGMIIIWFAPETKGKGLPE
jgi:MFS family permease